jgi:hypothetical protein
VPSMPRRMATAGAQWCDLHPAVRGPRLLGAKPHPIPAASRATAHDRRIHPHLGLMVLDRRAQNLMILQERSLG